MCVLTGPLHAQTEAADFSRIGYAGYLTTTASDYQCVGINPANLGFIPQRDVFQLSNPMEYGIFRSEKKWTISAAEGGVSIHSDALNRTALFDMITQTTSGTFTQDDKVRAATAFADKGVRFSVDLIALGIAHQSGSWGGIALTIRERLSGTFRFNEEAARLAFEGRYFDYFDSLAVNYNGDTVGYSTNPRMFSDLFDNTRLAMIWYRELGCSYGLQVIGTDAFSINIGAGIKYLLGYALIDANVERGNLRARSSLSPGFGISYGKARSSSTIEGNDFRPVGSGWSMDLGITLRYESFALGVSAIDIGRMFWDGNVWIARDTILNGMSSTGFSSYNIFEEAPKITGEGNYFKWDGASLATSNLPARLRVGGSYQYTSRWRFGADVLFPLNTSAGALGEPIVSVGADWRPLVWLNCGAGLGWGGNMGMFLPISVMFSVFGGTWEMGISSRDIFTFLVSDRPIVSVVVGVARIRL